MTYTRDDYAIMSSCMPRALAILVYSATEGNAVGRDRSQLGVRRMGSHIYENAIITTASRLSRIRCNWIGVMRRFNSYESVLLGRSTGSCSLLSWERMRLTCIGLCVHCRMA